eukprot:scaffold13933_cov219-Amphora_coffeaeformis.AAC.6
MATSSQQQQQQQQQDGYSRGPFVVTFDAGFCLFGGGGFTLSATGAQNWAKFFASFDKKVRCPARRRLILQRNRTHRRLINKDNTIRILYIYIL